MNRHIPHPSIASDTIFARVAGRLLRKVAGIRKTLRNRHEVRHLAELDDRILRDIGLSRSEVDGALGEPLLRDPSVVLVRSVERRARIQAKPPELKRQRPVVELVKGARWA